MERKVQFRPNEANCFFRLLNYKKIQYEKQVATKCIGFSIIDSTPPFANTMLSAVFIIFQLFLNNFPLFDFVF